MDRIRPALAGVRKRAWVIVVAGFFVVGAAPVAAQEQRLPALTPVPLILDAAISSNKNLRGDRFPIRVAEDVAVDGVVVIPAGAVGEGEVVHAAKSRAGGKAGELILAARYVTVAGREVRLRSFTAGSGKDRSNAAIAVGIFAGPVAFLVRGGELVMPLGMLGSAKTSEDLDLPAAAPADLPRPPFPVSNPTHEESRVQ